MKNVPYVAEHLFGETLIAVDQLPFYVVLVAESAPIGMFEKAR